MPPRGLNNPCSCATDYGGGRGAPLVFHAVRRITTVDVHRTQRPLSMAVRDLEQTIGAQNLLERRARCRLTPFGDIAYQGFVIW